MARFSTFMIALVIVSILSGLFVMFLSGLNQGYERSDYSPSELEVYNKLNDLSVYTTNTTESVKNIAAKEGIFDVIGGFFSLGWTSLKGVFASLTTFDTMMNAGLDDANLGDSTGILKYGLTTILLILLFIGVVLSAILKWQV